LETFPSWKIVNNLTFTHNTNKITQAIVYESSYPQSSLSSPLLNIFQSLMETHPYFYDPIEIQLEKTLKKKEIENKVLIITVHSDYRFNFLSSIRFVFLLLTFELYIHAGIKMRKWLHWKYDYT